jgi:rare lipoprotein A
MNSRKSTQLLFGFLLLFATAFQSYAGTSPQFGKAAYYHDKFQGRKTANGELYDKEALTAAHKTLPFGTIIKVTRIDNGMAVEVRVNDRGPYKKGFIVDLSRKAAQQIDLIKAGITEVKLEVIETEVVAPKPVLSKAGDNKTSTTVPTLPELTRSASYSPTAEIAKGATAKSVQPMEGKVKPLETVSKKEEKNALYQIALQKLPMSGFGVQIGGFTALETALDELAKVQRATSGAGLLKLDTNENGQTLYKVLLGPYSDKAVADKERKAASKKHPKCFVVDLAE